jgi:glutamate carboxypeptidase
MPTNLLVSYFHQRHAEILDTIGQLVTQETPSYDKPRLDVFAEILAGRLSAAGASVEIIAQPARGNHVRARFVHGNETAQPALVLCHYDTVWPVGALTTHPVPCRRWPGLRPGHPGHAEQPGAGGVQPFAPLLRPEASRCRAPSPC